MLVTKTSLFTGVTRTRDLPITQAQMDAYHGGELIQVAFGDLSDADREWLMTGVTEAEWADQFAETEEDKGFYEAVSVLARGAGPRSAG